jgi:hypothetical protein
MKRNGMCPICFVKNMLFGSKTVAPVPAVPEYESVKRRTPLMGWSSWNTFRGNINEDLIYDTAKAMADSGLKDAGYTYVNIDDCWHSNNRDENGDLVGDYIAFASGIPALVKKVNALGLKLGIYSSNGTLTCEDLPASYGNETRDAYTIAKWGIEYFKYDFCHNIPLPSYAPLVYGITVAPYGTKDAVFYNCSNGILGGLARFMKDSHVDGGRHVSGLDGGKGSLTFNNVFVEKEGKYSLTINIRKKGQYEKYLIAEVNGTPYEILFPSQKHYNWTARFQVAVDLKAGVNVVKLYNPVGDRIDSATLLYRRMAKALRDGTKRVADETGNPEKPILFSICEWGFRKPWLWGATAGNMWRTTPDIRPWWPWIKIIYERNVRLYNHATPAHYNDPDMLEVGNGKLTYNQNLSHFALWCYMNAPLVLGNDLRTMPESVKDIVTNKGLIAINQDAKCKQAKRVKRGMVDVLAKPVEDGTAICFFNKTASKKKVSFNLEHLASDSYVNAKFGDNVTIKNIVGNANLKGKKVSATLEKDAVVCFVVK